MPDAPDNVAVLRAENGRLRVLLEDKDARIAQGLIKVDVTVRDLMAGWFGGAGLARGGVPGAGGP